MADSFAVGAEIPGGFGSKRRQLFHMHAVAFSVAPQKGQAWLGEVVLG